MSKSYTIDVVSDGPSNSVRSHSHPILESGNLSFPDGRYILEMRPTESRSSFFVNHRIEEAPLIERLLQRRQAQYACIVSSPISSYRRTHVSFDAQHEVVWESEALGEPPLFTPMILCKKAQTIKLNAKRDGVHQIWHNQRIKLEKGSRLALGSVIQLESSMLQLLSLQEYKDLQEGQFFVEINEEPFRFQVKLSTDLHRFLRRSGPIRNHIMTHIVSACLARLQKEYGKDDEEVGGWRSFRNLLAFSDYLKDKGQKLWCDDDFQPERVATALYPHVLPSKEEEDV